MWLPIRQAISDVCINNKTHIRSDSKVTILYIFLVDVGASFKEILYTQFILIYTVTLRIEDVSLQWLEIRIAILWYSANAVFQVVIDCKVKYD